MKLTPAELQKFASSMVQLSDDQIVDRLLVEKLASGAVEERVGALLAAGRDQNPFGVLEAGFEWPYPSSVDWVTGHLCDFTGDPVESFFQNDAGARLPMIYLPVEPRHEQRTREAARRVPMEACSALLKHVASGKIQRAAQAHLDQSKSWPDAVAIAAILKAPNTRAPYRAVTFWRAGIIAAMTQQPYTAHFSDDEGRPLTWEFLPTKETLQ